MRQPRVSQHAIWPHDFRHTTGPGRRCHGEPALVQEMGRTMLLSLVGVQTSWALHGWSLRRAFSVEFVPSVGMLLPTIYTSFHGVDSIYRLLGEVSGSRIQEGKTT